MVSFRWILKVILFVGRLLDVPKLKEIRLDNAFNNVKKYRVQSIIMKMINYL